MNKINQHTHVLFAYVDVTGEREGGRERKRGTEKSERDKCKRERDRER
jgi:hypothetical protein